MKHTGYIISLNHHLSKLYITLLVIKCHFNDKVCQWLAAGRSFSPGPPLSSTNKTDLHDITEILVEVALNTIKQTSKTFSKNNVQQTATLISIHRLLFFFIIMSYPDVNNNSLNRKMLIQEYDKLSKILQLRERQMDKFQDGKMAF
jgi:hypothetical protein